MTKLTLIFVALVVSTVAVVAQQNDQQLLDDLVKRGNGIVDNAKKQLADLKTKHSYYVEPLQAEISRVEKFIIEMQNAAKSKKFTAPQIGLLEARLFRYENELLHMIEVATLVTKDDTFLGLIHLIDKLLTRAYADLGKLITSQGHNYRLVAALQAEIVLVQKLESEIKRLNPVSHTDAATFNLVGQIVHHESVLENLLFEAEHESLLNPM